MKKLLLTTPLVLCFACSGSGESGDDATGSDSNGSTATDATTATTDPTTTTSTTDPTAGTSTTDPTAGTSTTDPTAGSDSDSDTSDTSSFVQEPDGGGESECDPQKQDCPDGEKCTAWADDGGNSWNANKCVPVTGDGVDGDPCMTEGGGVSGLDDCAKGFICFNTDENMMGTCTAFCDEDENCPTGSECSIQNDGSLPVCEVGCDPLLQDCPMGSGCYAIDGSNGKTICMQDASGNGGQDGEPCEYDNVCDPGLVCIGGSFGCQATWCCTPWCDLSAANTCPGTGEQCVAHFEDPPPGKEDVGICVVP